MIKIAPNPKPVLITGGCGFVGRNLSKKLLDSGKNIWIVDDLSIGQHPNKWLESDYKESVMGRNVYMFKNNRNFMVFVKADVIDYFSEDLKKQKSALPGFSDVFHLASIVGGRELIDGNPILVAKDLAIDSIFFNWIASNRERIERILYASSSAAYPVHLQQEQEHTPLKEDYISFGDKMGLPDMTYGWGKLTGEYLSRLAAKKYGLHIACIRPFSGYGEDQDFSYPIPAIAKRVSLREDPLTVWGSGKQGRDFIHIDDCINAFFVILDHIKDGSGCNIGSGRLTNFLEVLQTFAKIEGYSPKIQPLLDKPVGVSARYADTSLVNSFGWRPKISNEEGFKRVLSYVKAHIR